MTLQNILSLNVSHIERGLILAGRRKVSKSKESDLEEAAPTPRPLGKNFIHERPHTPPMGKNSKENRLSKAKNNNNEEEEEDIPGGTGRGVERDVVR